VSKESTHSKPEFGFNCDNPFYNMLKPPEGLADMVGGIIPQLQ
jgi:hypothetical protein